MPPDRRPTYKISAEEILLGAGAVDVVARDKIRKALEIAALPDKCFAQFAVELGYAEKENVLEILSAGWGMGIEKDPVLVIDYKFLDPDRPFQNLLPLDFCKEACVVPLLSDGKSIRIAVPAPLDPIEIDDIKLRTALEVTQVVSLAKDIAVLLGFYDFALANRRIGPGGDIRSIIEDLLRDGKMQEALDMDPKIVNMILSRKPADSGPSK